MVEYARSKDLHKTLRRVWNSHLKPLGYKRCKGTTAGYFRPRRDGEGYLRFWSQASQWGDSWSGNQFTLNIDILIKDPNAAFVGSDRFLGDISTAELEIAESIVKRVIERKPKPQSDHWIYQEMSEGENSQFWRDEFDRAFTYQYGTLRPNSDIWLPYFSTEDIHEWAEFLGRLLPNLLDDRERSNCIFGKKIVLDHEGNIDFKKTLN